MTILFFCREIIYIVLAKLRFIVQQQSNYLSNDNHILLYRNICLVLSKACFSIQKWRLPFGWQSYSFVEKYMLSLSQGVLYCTKIERLPFGWQSYSFVEKYTWSFRRRVLVYKNSACLSNLIRVCLDNMRHMTIFCTEIYA